MHAHVLRAFLPGAVGKGPPMYGTPARLQQARTPARAGRRVVERPGPGPLPAPQEQWSTHTGVSMRVRGTRQLC